jgi:hypothetical protein
MTPQELRSEALTVMTNAFRYIEAQVQPPIKVPHKGGFVFRYAEKNIHQALIQKLARMLSSLNALEVLLQHGFVQELGVLLRTLDEIHEDIYFLAAAVTIDKVTDLHTQYLDAFYAESILSRPDGSLKIEKPNLPPRKKIRAYIFRVLGKDVNLSQAIDASESVSAVYSGYVHAASEFIMDLYGGNPPMFYVNGMRDTPKITSYFNGTFDYFLRSILTTMAVAKAFGDKALGNALQEYLDRYDTEQSSHELSREKI